MKSQICIHCKCKKLITDFSFREKRNTYYTICKECIKVYHINWYKQNSLRLKKLHQKNLKQIKNCILKKRFGINLEQYNQLLEAQNGVCAICEQEETRTQRNGNISALAVDHDHKTGKVRGLLCSGCNVSLGRFKDNQTLLQNALNYLQRKT
jgi:hypothetical protein